MQIVCTEKIVVVDGGVDMDKFGSCLPHWSRKMRKLRSPRIIYQS
jgi:hypothetical protein